MQFDSGIQRLGDAIQEGQAGYARAIFQPGNRGLARPDHLGQLRLGQAALDAQAGELVANFKRARRGDEVRVSLLAGLPVFECRSRDWADLSVVQWSESSKNFTIITDY